MSIPTIKRRFISLLVALTVTAGVSAQQGNSVPATDASRSQVEGFERSLRGALDSAASKLSARVRQVFPDQPIVLQYQAQPVVTGVVMPDVGPVFHVLIPAIEDLSLKIFAMNARRPPASRVANTAGRVEATTVAAPDPMVAAVPPMTNPDEEYTTLVRESLIDAVLDHAMTLTIPSNQHVAVIAGELPTQPLSPFDPRSRMLILRLKGEDLIALRENRIDRETAKGRIKETKFPN
jgi:hypothetical protein